MLQCVALMSRERFPCGCVADARAWRELCPAHAAEVAELHARHAADIAARRVAEGAPSQAPAGVALDRVAAHDGAATS